MLSAAASQPTGALFDVVLLAHVVAAVVALGTVVASGVAAARVLATGGRPPPPGVARYFAPGTNWAGRSLHAVPLLGLALIGLSRGGDRLSDPWVLTGLSLWVLAAGLAEGVLWPAERRVQFLLAEPLPSGAVTAGAGGRPGGPGAPGPGAGGAGVTVAMACRRMTWAAAGVAALLVAAMTVMVVQP